MGDWSTAGVLRPVTYLQVGVEVELGRAVFVVGNPVGTVVELTTVVSVREETGLGRTVETRGSYKYMYIILGTKTLNLFIFHVYVDYDYVFSTDYSS